MRPPICCPSTSISYAPRSTHAVARSRRLFTGSPLPGPRLAMSKPQSQSQSRRYSVTFQLARQDASIIAGSEKEKHQHQSRHQPKRYAAIVAGAGPAGLAAVGNLLENGAKSILWVDERGFEGGRLERFYRSVPSNTKVSLFLSFATAVAAFRKIVDETPTPNAFSALEGLRKDKGCELRYAAELAKMLAGGLGEGMGVEKRIGRVEEGVADESGLWYVTLADASSEYSQHSDPSGNTPSSAIAPLLVLSTGSSPISPSLPNRYPHLKPISLDTCLSPTSLIASLPAPSEPATIALLGASHSAILILRSLYNLATTTHPKLRIYWFSRHPLRYAEDKGDWILRDNTGLKGEAADWAREMVDDDVFEGSGAGKVVKRIRTGKGEEERSAYDRYLPECEFVVEAVGFKVDGLPMLKKLERGREEVLEGLKHNGKTGGFEDAHGKDVKGLKGVGIAFPEKTVDPEGNEEMAVGMWKFMKFIQRVVPEWMGTEERVWSRRHGRDVYTLKKEQSASP